MSQLAPAAREARSADSSYRLTLFAACTGQRWEIPEGAGLDTHSLIPEGTIGSWSYAIFQVPEPFVAHFECPSFADAREHPHGQAC